MNKTRMTAVLFYIASALFYVPALIGLISGAKAGTNLLNLCIGTVMLILGSVYYKRYRDENDGR